MAKIPTILQGDESGEIRINLDEAHSYAGARLVVAYQGITRTFENLEAGGHVNLVFTHDETAAFALGTFPILARLVGASGAVETVDNADMRIKVTDCIGEVNAGGSFSIVPGQGYVPITDDGDLPARSNLVDVINKVNEIVHTLAQRSAVSLLAIAACAFSAFGASVQKADIGTLYPGEMVVTDVDFSGGGGAVDTNVIKDIVRDVLSTNGIRSVSGASRPLPAYLHALNFDDTYPEDAAWWYARADYSNGGGCSARCTGGVLERNYDFPFDDVAEFVVGISATTNRFASLGVANVGQDLTEAFVTSGKPSRFYKCLPGHTLDGINENGLAVEVNITTTSGVWRTTGEVHCLGAVRWALDHGVTAGATASNLAAKVYVPAGFGANFHYMVADAAETWIVENGEARKVDGVAVMTNFSADRIGGEGYERWTNLVNGASITSQWWTAAYDRNTRPIRVSDIGANYAQVWDAWDEQPREAHRGQRIGGIPWWQTLHTSVYDLATRTLRICVQERGDWYIFALPSVGGGKVKSVNGKDGEVTIDAHDVDAYNMSEIDSKLSPIEAQIAALQSGKRDKTDLTHYVRQRDDSAGWVVSGMKDEYGPYTVFPRDVDGYEYWFVSDNSEELVGITRDSNWDMLQIYLVPLDYFENRFDNPELGATATRDKIHYNDNVVPTSDSIALVSQFPSADQLLTASQRAEIAKVKDKADEFSEWETNIPEFYNTAVKWFGSGSTVGIGWVIISKDSGEILSNAKGDEESISLTWAAGTWAGGFEATATRKRVLRTGDAATPQELTNAISTNNPAFVSAVRNTPTSGMPEDMPSDWGTYGTVGAALAALAAFVKWAKAKMVAVIGEDGKPTDTFATDLLGKQVAKIPLEIVAATATEIDAVEGHAYSVTMPAGGITINFPTVPQGTTRAWIFQCRFANSGSANANVSFNPSGSVIKFDGTDCGIVKAGKDALLSAMWNGDAWDLVWKNQE